MEDIALRDMCIDKLVLPKTESHVFLPVGAYDAHMRWQAEVELARLFGVEHNFLKRNFLLRYESRLLSLEDIAHVLCNNGLVEDVAEAVQKANKLVDSKVGNARFLRYRNKDGEIRYKLEYVESPSYSSESTDDCD